MDLFCRGRRRGVRWTPAMYACCSSTLALLGGKVVAQEAAADPGGLEEIIVTAQRREESLQRAAIPVSAVSGDELINASVSDTENLSKLVPSLVIQPAGGSTMNMYLRGVGRCRAMHSVRTRSPSTSTASTLRARRDPSVHSTISSVSKSSRDRRAPCTAAMRPAAPSTSCRSVRSWASSAATSTSSMATMTPSRARVR